MIDEEGTVTERKRGICDSFICKHKVLVEVGLSYL